MLTTVEDFAKFLQAVLEAKGMKKQAQAIDVEPADRHSVKTRVPHFLDPDDR